MTARRGLPKSLAGVRTIPLSEHLVTALKQWRLRSKFSKQEDLVFPNQNGTHTCHGNIIKREFTPHFPSELNIRCPEMEIML